MKLLVIILLTVLFNGFYVESDNNPEDYIPPLDRAQWMDCLDKIHLKINL